MFDCWDGQRGDEARYIEQDDSDEEVQAINQEVIADIHPRPRSSRTNVPRISSDTTITNSRSDPNLNLNLSECSPE